MPLEFGDNAVTQAAIAPPADKTPASTPLLAPQTPLSVWLVLALVVGYLVTRS